MAVILNAFQACSEVVMPRGVRPDVHSVNHINDVLVIVSRKLKMRIHEIRKFVGIFSGRIRCIPPECNLPSTGASDSSNLPGVISGRCWSLIDRGMNTRRQRVRCTGPLCIFSMPDTARSASV